MRKRWIKKPYSDEQVSRFAVDAKIKNNIFAVLLYLRNIKDKNTAKLFIKRDMDSVPSPFLFRDMQICCDRIQQAIKVGEKITIYGDYDVDGITSISILYRYLISCGANVLYYVPERAGEGYGINETAIRKIADNGTKLIITVDCGITYCREIEIAKSLGMDVIVTDHHECGKELPDCVGILNPKMEGCGYPFSGLAGVGVTFRLVSALMNDTKVAFQQFGELLAVGTVADLVPLKEENRVYVYHGLKAIQNSSDFGLKKLLDYCGFKNKKIDTYSIAFGVAPRLNAAGRMGSARLAIDLFIGEDKQKDALAQELCNLNQTRQQIESKILDLALSKIEQNEYQKQKIIVVANEGWHQGIIGIIASKISDLYYRPVIVLGIEDGVARGSCRSIPGFNIHDALCHCSKMLTQFGGHEIAAGLTLDADKIDVFREKINDYAQKKMDDNLLIPMLEYDLELEGQTVNFDFVEKLSYFEPFGIENKKPLFVMRNVTVHNLFSLSGGKHLKFFCEKDGKMFDSIAFQMGEYYDIITNGSIIDIIFEMGMNEFNGKKKIQLTIKDFDIKGTANG